VTSAAQPISPRLGRRALRVTLIGSAAALGAGVLAGVPARVLMRLVALASGEPAHFSWAGSALIVASFALVVLPGAVLAAAWTGRLRWFGPALGAALLAVPATGIAGTDLGATRGFSVGTWFEVGAAGLGIYACIGALPVLALRFVALLDA